MQKLTATLAVVSLFIMNAATATSYGDRDYPEPNDNQYNYQPNGNRDYPKPTGWEPTYKTKYNRHGDYIVADGYYDLDELLDRMKKGWSVMVVYKQGDTYKKLPCEIVLVKYDKEYPHDSRGACVNIPAGLFTTRQGPSS